MATITDLLTAEDFFRIPSLDQPAELVRGSLVMMNMPGFRHGAVCGNVVYELRRFLEGRPLGRVISNDAGVVTERGPDTVRGPDVAYYSFERLPAQATPVGYPNVAPEIVFEVLSPSDRWAATLGKAGEYLSAGTLAVCIVDPEAASLTLCRPAAAPLTLDADPTLELPELHSEFSVPIRSLLA
ncbi:MAG: Uma2 family endonuclease [Pirellulales bacterium]